MLDTAGMQHLLIHSATPPHTIWHIALIINILIEFSRMILTAKLYCAGWQKKCRVPSGGTRKINLDMNWKIKNTVMKIARLAFVCTMMFTKQIWFSNEAFGYTLVYRLCPMMLRKSIFVVWEYICFRTCVMVNMHVIWCKHIVMHI